MCGADEVVLKVLCEVVLVMGDEEGERKLLLSGFDIMLSPLLMPKKLSTTLRRLLWIVRCFLTVFIEGFGPAFVEAFSVETLNCQKKLTLWIRIFS